MGQRSQWQDSWQRELYEKPSREKVQALCGEQHPWGGVGAEGEGAEEAVETVERYRRKGSSGDTVRSFL